MQIVSEGFIQFLQLNMYDIKLIQNYCRKFVKPLGRRDCTHLTIVGQGQVVVTQHNGGHYIDQDTGQTYTMQQAQVMQVKRKHIPKSIRPKMPRLKYVRAKCCVNMPVQILMTILSKS